MMEESTYYYSKHPAAADHRHHNNAEWDHSDERHCGSHHRRRTIDDGEDGRMQHPRSKVAVGHDCQQPLPDYNEEEEEYFHENIDEYQNEQSNEYHCRRESSAYYSDNERSNAYLTENRHHGNGSSEEELFACGSRESPPFEGRYDGSNIIQKHAERWCNDRDAKSSKENYDGNHGYANSSNNDYGRSIGQTDTQFHQQCHDEDSYSSYVEQQEERNAMYHQHDDDVRTDGRGSSSPLQERNGRELYHSQQEEDYYEEDEQQSFYDGDHGYHSDDQNIGHDYQENQLLDRIDIDHIERPQAMTFGDQEEEGYYDAVADEDVEDEVPLKEVTFVHDQPYDGIEYNQDHINNNQSYDDDSSSINSEPELERPPTETNKQSAVHINIQTSESLDVIHRIESVMESLFKFLNRKEEPILRGYVQTNNPRDDADDDSHGDEDAAAQAFIRAAATNNSNGDPKFYRSFGNIAQSRSFTSICLVLSFVHQLLLSNRTTTTREVYYVFVTHFRNQRECDGVILDVAKILGVSRRSLGLSASPKGWFCGCVEITRKGRLPSGKDVSGSIDGTALSSIQGLPITKEWTERDELGCTEDGVKIKVSSKNAKVILVIEKEGVYNRLSEERIFDRFPCILVTGKGFPDLATRALVNTLHKELDLPVVGLCDCNPYGISVLALYHCAGDRMGIDGRKRYSVPIQWLGLRPSDVARLKRDLPETVLQKLSDLDNKRISSLLDPEHPFLTEEDEEEVRDMQEAGYKVELEALYWLGPDYMGNWVVQMLEEEFEHQSSD